MRDDRLRYFAENMSSLSRRDRVFLNNPVIMQGMGLAAITIPANTLGNAFILAVGTALLLTPVRVIATAIGQRVGYAARAVIYVLTSGLVYFFVAMLMEALFGPATVSVGIYLPLLVLEPLIIKRYESPQTERVSTSVKKGLITTLGFCLVLLVMGGAREMLAWGTLGGAQVFRGALLPLAEMPAGGFILLGMAAALWRGGVAAFRRNIRREVNKL